MLDTQDSLSNIIGNQLQLIKNVTDTITNSHCFILLHHKLIWMYGNQVLESLADSIPNGGIGNCFYCINPNNFYDDIYPLLLQVKNRGINVICIAGDIGLKVKEFEYITPEGIYFLASGIYAGNSDNKILILEQNIKTKELTFYFKLVNEII